LVRAALLADGLVNPKTKACRGFGSGTLWLFFLSIDFGVIGYDGDLYVA